MRDFFHTYDPVSFVFPIDGDCLNCHDGREEDGVLYITVKIRAAENADLKINGKPALFDPEARLYYLEVPIYGYRNTLTAIDAYNGYRADVVVYKLYDPINKFYFTVDDTIVFLYDLNKNPEKYPSMFDHPFLAPFKKAHDLYGANVHLNLYWEFNEESARDFSDHKEYFNLSMMTDRYRPEFEANAHWLTLSYHAHANYPDMPCKVQSAEFIGNSIRMVHKEICRFAGPDSLIPATTMHWGNCYLEAQRAFRENGYRIEFGSFRVVDNDEAYLSYYGRDGLPRYIRGGGMDAYNRPSEAEGGSGRDFWKDNREDILFCHTDMVLNTIGLDQVIPWMDTYMALRPNSGFMHPMIHEEYYYQDYVNYIPDCAERVLTAIGHLYEKGYRSVPIQDIVWEK